jgi:D-tyrosyl-tRNA(Tyr) deacylase
VRALLQRVSRAQVLVEGAPLGAIGRGWAILLGIGPADDEATVRQMAERIANLRAFDDPAGKMNLSALDIGAEVLVVSQFTLYADTSRGRRPGFVGAAPPERAELLVRAFARRLQELGLRTASGRFGAHMLVEIHNDGPVTLALSSTGDPWGG